MPKEKLFSEREKEVLTKYKEGRVVDKGDENILKEWELICFVSFGFNWNTMESTAELTDSGKAHLNR